MIKQKKINTFFWIIIILSFILHLISINFHPTNFEGGYGAFANFFQAKNKIEFLEAYYISQFNTYLFSALASLINYLIPFLDGYQSVKILSASSYFFLGLGIINILKYYNFKDNKLIFLIVIFSNSIIWSYGFRAFNDLFSFSIGIYFFSKILISKNIHKVYLNSFFLGISTILKTYNLIFILPIFFLYIKKTKKKFKFNKYFIKLIIIIFIPFLIFHFIIYKYLGFFLAPKNEDLQIALIGNDENRNLLWVLNNFIFYIGYLLLLTFPFSLVFFFKVNNKIKIEYLFFFVFAFIFSLFFQKYLFISSELDFGPIQKYIPENIYKGIILFCFLFFIFLLFTFIKNNKFEKRKLKICLIIIFSIVCYLLALSFVKAAQRYLILPLPFIFLFLFTIIQPRIIVFAILIIYTFFNTFLLLNYYITGKSSEMVFNYLKKENILKKTNPGVITPHVYHLYSNCKNTKKKNKCNDNSNNTIEIISDEYKIDYYNEKAVYSSDVEVLGFSFKKYSIIKN